MVDQFEEVITACDDGVERARFLTALRALSDPAGPWAALLGVRIDFYADLAETAWLADVLQHAQALVGPMDVDELRSAIVEPAHQAGWTVDDDLVALLLRDFVPAGSLGGRHPTGALPLLSHALLATWSHATPPRMTVADYRAAGGLDGAVDQSAEQVFSTLPPAAQALARQVFLRLVQVGEGVVTRRHASFAELDGLTADAAAADTDAARDATASGTPVGDVVGADDVPLPPVDAVLDPFIEARLLTAHEATIEITHEALVTAWPRLRGWIEEDLEALREHQRIADATRQWVDSGRDPSTLASGGRLEAMRTWFETGTRTVGLNEGERAFLAASIAHAEATAAAARGRARRLRVLAAAAMVFGLLAGTLAVVAVWARATAVVARDEALSRQIALTAERLTDTDPTLAAQLAVAGYEVATTSEARSALLSAAIVPRSTRYLGGPGPTTLATTPDGALTAVSNAVDGTVQLFTPSAAGLRRAGTIALPDPETDIYALAVTPDGRTLAVGDTTAAVTLWDVSDPLAPTALLDSPLRGPAGPIQGLAIPPDGDELAAVGLGDGAFRWRIDDPSAPEPLPLLPSDHITWSVAYDPTGEWVVVGDDVGGVHVWRVTGPSAPDLVTSLALGEIPILSVAVGPAGGLVGAGSRSGAMAVWDVTSLEAPRPVEVAEPQFTSWVSAMAMSPDGALLAAGGSDQTMRVWDTTTWTPLQTLPHAAAVTWVRFTDDGHTILTTTADGTLHRWDRDRLVPARMSGSVFPLHFTADGTRVAAATGGERRTWVVTDPLAPVLEVDSPVTDPDAGFISSGALSPDGRLLAHGTRGGPVHLLDVSDPADPAPAGPPLEAATALVEAVVFSADGTLLATAADDTQVDVWDVADPAAPRVLAELDDPSQIVLNVAWSPAGDLLAAASADSRVYLYDTTDPDQPALVATLGGFESEAFAVAFSPDGRTLAMGGSDTTVLLWDVTDAAAPARIGEPITGPVARIADLAFDRDGDALAAAAIDGSLWVFDVTDPAAPRRHAVLVHPDQQFYTVEFSPTDDVLAASGADGVVRLWPVDETRVIEEICTTAGDAVTPGEWEIYLPDRPYDPPCAPSP